ncbi:hypothetical protein J1N35_013224 [Gossypium stocksii]|uniref:Uncharacterized protein n=1 Tax=Gossypium stocksii TaxID=47602 RepID=A0A9D4A6H7_9ROSI|nr:hypothetical protein J1N35_013224 [Gossypium stocksii]
MIHNDNLEVVQALQDNTLVESSITVLRRAQQIIRTEGRWLIQYVPREDSRGLTYMFMIKSLMISSDHFNLVFEGSIESVVELNPKILDSKRHLDMTFKKNLDSNSNFSSQPKGVLERENSLVDSKGGNSRRGRALSKTIHGREGRFKVVGNSHVPLPKTMASIAKLIGSQATLGVDRTE